MAKLEFRTQYTERKVKPGIVFTEPSLAKQAFKDQCDINNVLKRYNATGVLDHVTALQPVYADLTQVGDLQQAFDIVRSAQDAFDALPSELRNELDNNPANLLSFIQNPANKERCVAYGLFNKPAVETSETRFVDTGIPVSNNGNVSGS